MKNYSYSIDRDTMGEVQNILYNSELYLKKKKEEKNLSRAHKSDPRIRAFKNNMVPALEYNPKEEQSPTTPYERFTKVKHNQSLESIQDKIGLRSESQSYLNSGKRLRAEEFSLPVLDNQTRNSVESRERRPYKFNTNSNRIPLRENRNLKDVYVPKLVKLPPILATKLL